MLRRLNKALPGLVLGIIIYGVLLQAAGIWFVDDRLHYSTGLWIGIGCALFMAVHMAMSIEDAVTIGTEDGAKKKTVASVRHDSSGILRSVWIENICISAAGVLSADRKKRSL